LTPRNEDEEGSYLILVVKRAERSKSTVKEELRNKGKGLGVGNLKERRKRKYG